MFKLINIFTFFLIILFILLININKINLNKKKINFMNNIECGFNQMNNKHMPLYNNFFIILIIFLIFDLEFFLLIPLMILMKNFNWMKIILILIMTFFFMYFSMIYEIKSNCIKWIK